MFSVFQIVGTTVSAVSIVANGILLALSGNKTIDIIQELRHFLANVSISNIVFSTCILLLQPQTVVRGSMTIRIPHGFARHWPEMIVKLLAATSVTAYVYIVLSFPIFFIYRLVISSNSIAYGHYFSKRNMIFIFGIALCISIMDGSFFYFSNVDYQSLFDRLNRTSDALDQFKDPPATHLQILYTTTPSAHFPNQQQEQTEPHGQMQTANDLAMVQDAKTAANRISIFGDDYQRNPIIFLFLGVAGAAHLLSYIVVLACSYCMLKSLRKNSNTMSLNARMAHEVLVHAVFAEAFLPLMFSCPIVANSILCFIFTDSLSWQEYLPMYFFGTVPMLTPIISILFIQPYRHVALNYITFGYKERKEKSVRDQKQKEREDKDEVPAQLLNIHID